MFSLMSVLIHIINSVFSGIYTSSFLNAKKNKIITIALWSVLYFTVQVVVFDIIQNQYQFNNITGTVINILLISVMQLIFFQKNIPGQLFVCFSFIAGKEIVKYIASVLNVVLAAAIGSWVDGLVQQGKIITRSQVETLNNTIILLMAFVSGIVYALILGMYLILINRKYVRKEYQLQIRENVFLILPSIAAICISVTLKMMIITVENGTTTLIYDTVPATLIWIPVICILLLGTVIANVILFQNVVQYHEENRKRSLLENQIQQIQKEVREIQDVYTDMRGLRHDLKGHINNITAYVKKYNNAEDNKLNTYIINMEKTVSKLDFGYQSGNPITDIIVHQKKQEADKAGIEFSVDFTFPDELKIDVYDIGVILNNALENAIEACSCVKTDRFISLNSYTKGNLFFMEVENSFVKDVVINRENGLPESSKANRNFHGLGIYNIQRCARKYNGDIDIVIDSSKPEHKIFNITIMLNGKPAEF